MKQKQVGGRKIIKFEEERILKPVEKGEFEFYESVYHSNDAFGTSIEKDLFVQISPKYFGMVEIDGSSYLALENLTFGMENMENVFVLDCKLGVDGYAKNHSSLLHKKLWCEFVSSISTQRQLGFRIAAMKRGDLIISKSKGRILSSKGVQEAFLSFFGDELDAVKKSIELVTDIEEFFDIQKTFSFFSTSILFIFDTKSRRIEVRIVDFAHVFKENISDISTLTGVRGVLSLLKKVENSIETSKNKLKTLD